MVINVDPVSTEQEINGLWSEGRKVICNHQKVITDIFTHAQLSTVKIITRLYWV